MWNRRAAAWKAQQNLDPNSEKDILENFDYAIVRLEELMKSFRR